MAVKHIVFFGQTTATGASNTVSEPGVSSITGAPSWSTDKSEYSRMDVIINIVTITGGGNMTFSVQERFSDVGFVETAKSTALSSTGSYVLANDGQTGQTATANIAYGFAMMGKGIDKQIVTTKGGTVTAFTANIYLAFYK